MKEPTQRTLIRLRASGFGCDVVERWIPQARKRKDVAGCIDIIAWKPGEGILGIQATSDSNHAARRTKAIAEPRLREWLESGGRFCIYSWGMKGSKGTRKLWTLRVEEIKPRHLSTNSAVGPDGEWMK